MLRSLLFEKDGSGSVELGVFEEIKLS